MVRNLVRRVIFPYHRLQYFVSCSSVSNRGNACKVTRNARLQLEPSTNWQEITKWAFTCSNLTIETLEHGVIYVQS